MVEHVQEVHEKIKNFFCGQCDFASFRKNSLNRHIARMHNKERHEDHKKTKHAPEMLLSPEVEAAKNTEQHYCRWVLDDGDFCGRSFTKFESMRRHIEELHKGNRPHKCHLCEKSYGRKDYLDRHIMRIHENTNTPEKLLNPEVILKVDIDEGEDCGPNDPPKAGSMPDSDGDEAPVPAKRPKANGTEICTWELEDGSVCGKAFTKFDSLKQHRRQIHKGIRPHACHVCGKSYGRRDYLERHIALTHEKATSTPNSDDHREEKSKICKWIKDDGEFSWPIQKNN